MKRINHSYEDLYKNLKLSQYGLNIYNNKQFIKIKTEIDSPAIVTLDGILLCIPSTKYLQSQGSLLLDDIYYYHYHHSETNNTYIKAKKQAILACNYFGFHPEIFSYSLEGRIIADSIVQLKTENFNIVNYPNVIEETKKKASTIIV